MLSKFRKDPLYDRLSTAGSFHDVHRLRELEGSSHGVLSSAESSENEESEMSKMSKMRVDWYDGLDEDGYRWLSPMSGANLRTGLGVVPPLATNGETTSPVALKTPRPKPRRPLSFQDPSGSGHKLRALAQVVPTENQSTVACCL